MLARWIATVAALLLACAQAGAHVRTERVGDLVNLADVTAPLGDLAQPSKTAPPARASLGEPAPGENPPVTHCHVWQKSFSTAESTSGTTIWRWDSAPFGETAANEQPTAGLPSFTLNLRFPGQQYDRETGTHYNYFRDYEAQTGRYVQSDPVGLDDDLGTFNYVGAAPLTSVDPRGLGRCTKVLESLNLCKPRVPKPDRPDLNVPGSGGLYTVRDCHGNVVYVGQTNNYKKRFNSHWGSNGQFSAWNKKCCPISVDYDPMKPGASLNQAEREAIRKHQPRGNTLLKKKPKLKKKKGLCC